MLYKGADLIRDLEYVIIDEAHYLSDSSRGVVWEEVIIMLPAHVQLILLSATVPNVKEFADWIGRTKKKDIYVISTSHRPVPLEHFLYVPSVKEYFRFVDVNRKFIPDGIKVAHNHILGIANKTPEQLKQEKLQTQQRNSRGGRGRGGRGGGVNVSNSHFGKRDVRQNLDKTTWSELVGLLNKRNLLPVTIFVFSRKGCEDYADCLASKDLLTAGEKSEVHVFVERSISRLRQEDRKLPQIERMREMISRGIAVHHSGLLPLVKEIIEILFARGIIKILFATETFSMGVNMPTKCVVFANIRKHDGLEYRYLYPGEYTQMSGRAGRRGLDPTGMVLIMCLDEPQPNVLQQMVLGTAPKLSSQFRLTYNMILNLLRVETLKVEEMMKRSFSENSSQKMLPEAERKYVDLKLKLVALPPLSCLVCALDLDKLYDTTMEIQRLAREMNQIIIGHPVGAKALSIGRIVIISSTQHYNTLGVILSKQRSTTQNAARLGLLVFILTERRDTITLVNKDENEINLNDEQIMLPVSHVYIPEADKAKGQIIRVLSSDVMIITQDTIPVNSSTVQNTNGYEANLLVQTLRQYANDHDGKYIENDWTKIRELEFQELIRKKQKLIDNLKNIKARHCPDLKEHYARLHQEREIRIKMKELRQHITSQNLELLPEYHQRMAILEHFGYVDPRSRTVQIKGRVACEINSCDEVLLTEMILNNMFVSLDVSETIALLSILVYQEKNEIDTLVNVFLSKEKEDIEDQQYRNDDIDIARMMIASNDDDNNNNDIISRWPQRLINAMKELKKMYEGVKRIQQEFGIEEGEKDILLQQQPQRGGTELHYGMVEVAYQWAKGLPFQQIMVLTTVQEGSIVRCIRRLADTCREIRDAARLIGDGSLYQKMELAETSIKRDIIFVASLYI